MNLRITYILLIQILVVAFINAQTTTEWAGPDKYTCGQKGVMIGSNDPCSNCCYSWTPTTGLSDATIKNPIARPDKPTTYTVTVVDENLSWVQSDAVKVKLSFGELHFEPDHLEQGTEDIALVRLVNNTQNFPTLWSLPDPLGCSIDAAMGDPDLATIHPGAQYGKLQVKVQNVNDEECYYIGTIPINNGVKDLVLKDLNNPKRMATTGQTLYLVGTTPSEVVAKLIAIPNEGGFEGDNPDYKPHSSTTEPIDGEDEQEVTELPLPLVGNTAVYQAGEPSDFDPKITAVRVYPTEDAGDPFEFFENLGNFFAFWEQTLDFEDIDINVGGTPPGPSCPDIQPFDASFNHDLVLKEIEVEKYNDPGIGVKKDLSLDLGVHIAGKAYHPALTRQFVKFGFGICSELYAGIEFNNDFHISWTSDESLEDDSWKMNDPQLEIAMIGSAGFSAIVFSGIGLSLSASGSAAVSSKIILDYIRSTNSITAYTVLNPLTIKIEAKVLADTNMGEYEPIFDLLSEEIVLFKGLQTDPITLYSPSNN